MSYTGRYNSLSTEAPRQQNLIPFCWVFLWCANSLSLSTPSGSGSPCFSSSFRWRTPLKCAWAWVSELRVQLHRAQLIFSCFSCFLVIFSPPNAVSDMPVSSSSISLQQIPNVTGHINLQISGSPPTKLVEKGDRRPCQSTVGQYADC